MDVRVISILILSVLQDLVYGHTISSPAGERSCHTSGDCEPGECCRNSIGELLTLSGVFDHVGPIHLTDYNGTCVSRVAQLREHCSEFCPCDESQGLECYRDVIEDGFIPPMCREKDFVNQKTKDFIECYNNPSCVLPIE